MADSGLSEDDTTSLCPDCTDNEMAREAERFAIRHNESSLDDLLRFMDRADRTPYKESSTHDELSKDPILPAVREVYAEQYGHHIKEVPKHWPTRSPDAPEPPQDMLDDIAESVKDNWNTSRRKMTNETKRQKIAETFPLAVKGEYQYQQLSKSTASIIKYLGAGTRYVTIPSKIANYKVVAIGSAAFEGHTEIENISTFADIRSIGDNAFKNCSSLKSCHIPYSVKTIGESAFEGCMVLKSAHVWDATRIGAKAFKGCVCWAEDISLSLKEVGESAFEDCRTIKKITLYSTVHIGKCAFRGCTGIKEINFWHGADIGDYAFFHCTSLSKLSIRKDETSIGLSAFGECPKLKDKPSTDAVIHVSPNVKKEKMTAKPQSGKKRPAVAPRKPVHFETYEITVKPEQVLSTAQQIGMDEEIILTMANEPKNSVSPWNWEEVISILYSAYGGMFSMGDNKNASISEFEDMMRRLIREELASYFSGSDKSAAQIPIDSFASVREKMASNQSIHCMIVPPGVYKIGVDIPAGRYTLRSAQKDHTPWIDIGATMKNSGVTDSTHYGTINGEDNVSLSSGYIQIKNCAVEFREFSPSFKFK